MAASSDPALLAPPALETRLLARMCAGAYIGEMGHFWREVDPALRSFGFESAPGSVTALGSPPLYEGFVIRCWHIGQPDGPMTAVVVVRGTRTAAEGLANLNALRVRMPGKGRSGCCGMPWAHAGFSGMWRPVAVQIRDELLATGGGRWIFTGCSRGGAMAALAAADAGGGELRDRIGDDAPVPILECVTFCAPRPGGAGLARLLGSSCPDRCERWVVGTDLVPHVPPAILGFHHGGRCRYVKALRPGVEAEDATAVGFAGTVSWWIATGAAPSLGRRPCDDHNIDCLVSWFDSEGKAGRTPWAA